MVLVARISSQGEEKHKLGEGKKIHVNVIKYDIIEERELNESWESFLQSRPAL